jgi:hypothetical protein
VLPAVSLISSEEKRKDFPEKPQREKPKDQAKMNEMIKERKRRCYTLASLAVFSDFPLL